MRFGQPRRHLRECPSTNSLARELALEGAPDGLVVTADSQTAGRGRQGRAWATPPGGASLAYSALMRTDASRPSRISPLLPLAVAIAACEAIETLAPVKTAIKWPNDIWIQERKCAGILVEARPQEGWAVIGIGLNLAVGPDDLPPEARTKATSIGHGATPADATKALNVSLSEWIDRPSPDVIAAFSERDALTGKRISWADGTGTAAGIDESGNLKVRGEAGTVETLAAGEVHLRL